MSKRVLFITVALVVCCGSAFGAALYNLGVGVSTGVVWDGTQPIVSFFNNNATAGTLGQFVWTPSATTRIGTAGDTGGIALQGSKVIISGNAVAYGTGAKRWDGNASGVGTWSDLPLGEETYAMRVQGVTATASNVYITGYYVNSGSNYIVRYEEASAYSYLVPGPSVTGYHPNAIGYAVSSTGAIAGQSQYGGTGGPASGQPNAVAGWSGSAMYGLNTLNGAPSGSLQSAATSIAYNNSRVVGWTQTQSSPVNVRKACYWNGPIAANGAVPVLIPQLTGLNFTAATAVSEDGFIVGGYTYDTASSTTSRACFLWDPINGTRELKAVLASYGLDTTGWQFTYVSGFADHGRTITGYGWKDGNTSVLQSWAVTIPEPSSFASISVFVLGLLPLVRRRKK